MSEQRTASYKPSAHYWRKEIREANTQAKLRRIALALVSELEEHKAEFRRNGLMPPKSRACASELQAKPALAQVIQAVEWR